MTKTYARPDYPHRKIKIKIFRESFNGWFFQIFFRRQKINSCVLCFFFFISIAANIPVV